MIVIVAVITAIFTLFSFISIIVLLEIASIQQPFILYISCNKCYIVISKVVDITWV